jgi:23S rRNA (uracil1939-C5)-methyltransferase
LEKQLTVDIEKIVYGGKGMGRAGGKVVFIPFTAPGDRVTAEISKEKKNYLEAELRTIEKPSPKRIPPFCPVFALCGGCHLQHLGYDDQISIKEENLRGFLHRLFSRRRFEILPTLRAPQDRGYRIRAQLKGSPAGGRTTLGFYGIRSHRVVGIDRCPLLHPLADEILREIGRAIRRPEGNYRLRGADIFVSPEEKKGIIRLTGMETGGLKILQGLVQKSSFIKGAQGEVKGRTSWGDLLLRFLLPGEPATEPIEVSIPADSFFQVNALQNMNLIQKVRDWAGLTGRERVLDLFCGAGNLSLPLAQKAGKIWGVDSDPAAISAAKENARRNGLKNCFFRAVRADAGVSWALAETDRLDLVVLDPPRAGAAEALAPLARLRPSKILYVSCEPPTLVRDLFRLGDLGYQVTRLQPLDMFPQTYHLEVIAELQLAVGRQRGT